MDVVLIILRNVVVDHQRKVIDLKSAGCHISGHQEAGLALLELVQGLLPLGLREVSGEVVRVIAVVPEPCAELLRHVPAVREKQGGLRGVCGKKLQEQHELLGLRHMVKLLGYALDSYLVRLKVDLGRVVHELPCEVADAHLKRGGEKQGLPCALVRQKAEHLLDIGIEAHVEHAVGLVNDKGVDALCIQLLVLHELKEAARSSDIDVTSHLKQLSLVLIAHSAIEDPDVESLHLGAQDHGIVRYLLRKLPGGSDYETGGVDPLLLVPEVFLQKCDDVDCGLAASGL